MLTFQGFRQWLIENNIMTDDRDSLIDFSENYAGIILYNDPDVILNLDEEFAAHDLVAQLTEGDLC